jgi:hypothetical protein
MGWKVKQADGMMKAPMTRYPLPTASSDFTLHRLPVSSKWEISKQSMVIILYQKG